MATALFLFGCVWTLIGVFMLTAPGVRWMGLLWTALSLAFTVAIVHQELVGRPKLRAALENGACKRVEGAVERFSPLPRRDWGRGNRARWEEFYVDGVRFAYDDHPVSSAYIKIAARGGPIRAGLRVRIQYVSFPDRPTKWQPQRNVILHLEILK